MIDLIDRQMEDWIKGVLGEVEVSLAAPGVGETGQTVGLYLLDVIHVPALRNAQRPPLQLLLRYLLTTRAERPQEAHRMLGELAFAALESTEFDVEPGPVSEQTWSAFGVAPRPSLLLRVPLRRERPEESPAARVMQPLIVESESLTSIDGRVVGPGGEPVAGARVESPAAGKSARTDAEGRFSFSAFPSGPRSLEWRIKARGKEFNVTTERSDDGGPPLVINLQGLED